MLELDLYSIRIKITDKQWKMIDNWLTDEFAGKKKNNLYRGCRDGFTSTVFHTLCNGKGPTLTIIKNNQDRVCGGFNYNSWSSDESYNNSNAEKCFLFSLTKGEKYDTNPSAQNIVYNAEAYGPTFGGGNDLYIAADMKTNSNSSTKSSYAIPDNNELTGTNKFIVVDIEVYNFI